MANRYELPQLIKLWAQEKVSAEQAIGQILLHVQLLIERVDALEVALRQQSQEK